MSIMETILSRRSVRSYTGEPVTEAELHTLLAAAHAAPVGRGLTENVALTVITSGDFMARLNALTGREALYGAPLMILISAKLDQGDNNVPFSNAAGIAENIALAAFGLGLGSCHIWGAVRALNTCPEMVAELALPEGMTPCCAVIVGRTEETIDPRDTFGRYQVNYLK